MQVKIKLLHPDAVMPTKAHNDDAAYDLTAVSRSFDDFGNVVYGFGLALEIPEGYAGFIYPRSSICKYDIVLSNAVGVVDAGYRGEITAKFKPVPRLDADKEVVYGCKYYHVGDRVAQLIIRKVENVEFEGVQTLSDTERGTGGYGSTDKKH